MPEQQWMSIVEYARKFSVSDMTVRRRIKTGKLRAELRDGKYYIPIGGDAAHVSPAAPTLPEESDGFSSMTRSLQKSHPEPAATHLRTNAPPGLSGLSESESLQGSTIAPKITSTPMLEIREEVPKKTPDHRGPSAALPSIGKSSSMLDAMSIIRFAEKAMERSALGEERLKEQYEARIRALALEIKQRDNEIISLKQGMEDLQTLIKILEDK